MISKIIYIAGLQVYKLVLHLVAPFNIKAKQMVDGRREWKTNLAKQLNGRTGFVWFHCASLGEFEQGRPVIEAYKATKPDAKILVTFFSPSGYEIRKNYAGADVVAYLPFDSRRNARLFLDMVQPEKAVFVKYEYWYYFLSGLNQRKVPTYLISAIFRPAQPFFRWYGGFYRKMLTRFTQMYVQNEDSAVLLRSIRADNFEVAGDTRFDRVMQVAQTAKKVDVVEAFANGKPLMVAGSTWPQDETLLLAFIKNYSGDYKFVLVPHEVTPSHIAALERMIAVPYALFSKEDALIADKNVLVIDTIGLLSSAYRYANIAYIGGGFGVGIHNTLEAATYGIPVLWGPNYLKFHEAIGLAQAGGGFPVNDIGALTKVLNQLLNDNALRIHAGEAARCFVQNNGGATDKVLKALLR